MLYQLGGYRPQLQWHQHTYDNRILAEEIAGPGSPLQNRHNAPIELILGIMISGTVHLLLTHDEVSAFCRRNRNLPWPRAPPFVSNNFESLSPIYFHTVEELTNLLDKLKPKKTKQDFDTSTLNKGFRDGNAGVLRGAFEHGRVFYKVLHRSIDLQKYGMRDSSWTRSIRVCSFVFNTPHILFDGRSTQDRLRYPRVLDIAFAEAKIPSLELDPGTATHIIKAENRTLNKSKGSFRLPFAHGTTDTLLEHEISNRFQDIFRSCQDRPTILLVYEEELTKNVLKNLGVPTEAFRTDLKHLLGFEVVKKMEEDQKPLISSSRDPRNYSIKKEEDQKPQISPSRDPRNYTIKKEENDTLIALSSRTHDPRTHTSVKKEDRDIPIPNSRNHHRSRSRSPRRNNSSPDKKPYTSREDYHRPHHPIYIIDVKDLHARVSGESFNAYDVNAPEMSLMKLARGYGVSSGEGWCAGNEAGYIFDIWRSIISGPPIDQQIERWVAAATSVLTSTAQPQPQQQQQQPTVDPDDEDYDPNDLPANPLPPSHTPSSGGAAMFDDGESDYGEGFDPDADDDDDDDDDD